MKTFNIQAPDKSIEIKLQNKIDYLTKPKGSLGRLEEMAIQIGTIQQTLTPHLLNPQHIIFGGDHGITAEGVSFSPAEVTPQMVFNFLKGGAGINFLVRQHNFSLKIVDAGINYDFEKMEGVIDRKVRMGTRNYLHEAAITNEEFNQCIEHGAQIVKECFKEGSNIISFGEMGIGNTSASSIWMHLLTNISLEKCVGAGSGFDDEGIRHKYSVLKKAVENFTEDLHNTTEILRYFGGYEMVMAVGAMLQAAELKMIIIVDGFIMSSCALAASKLYPNISDYFIFGHQGDEHGHKFLLDYMGAKPLLKFGLRLGEGTGAVCSFPLIDSAVRMVNEMSTFEHAKVTKYFDQDEK